MPILVPMVMSARSFKCAADDILLGLVFATWHVTAPKLAPNCLLVDSDGFHASPKAWGIPGTLPVASASPRCGGDLQDECGDAPTEDFFVFWPNQMLEIGKQLVWHLSDMLVWSGGP